MDNYARMLRLVDQLYGAVLDEDALPTAFACLSEFAGARSAFHLTADAKTGAILAAESVNIDPVVQREYVEHWSNQDVLVPPALSVPVGHLMTEHALLPRGQFERSEIYNDLYKLHDIPHLLVLWAHKTRRVLTAVSLQRARMQGPFLKEDEERYRAVVPHLVRALRVRRMLGGARRQSASTIELINALPFGVVFLGDSGSVIEASDAAEALLRDEEGILVQKGLVRAAYADDDRRLQRAIWQTLSAKAEQRVPGATITIRRRALALPLTVTVMPVTTEHVVTSRTPACMLIIFDPNRTRQPQTAAVRKTLGLTGAEARLACALFTGITLREAAERLGLTVNTCKSQLKSIYGKTGSRSHVDLAKAVLFAALSASPDQYEDRCTRDHLGLSIVREVDDYADGRE